MILIANRLQSRTIKRLKQKALTNSNRQLNHGFREMAKIAQDRIWAPRSKGGRGFSRDIGWLRERGLQPLKREVAHPLRSKGCGC